MNDATSNLWGPPVLAVVLSEFGRDAALDFCVTLSDLERERISSRADVPFFDEYRRLTLAVVGDLPFVKAPALEPHRRDDAPVDQRILVGFPGGMPLERVVPRLGLLALEAMRGPVARGVEQVQVLLPCNTLAAASWALSSCFASADALCRMIEQAVGERTDLRDLLWQEAGALLSRAAIRFPTVPEAVLAAVSEIGAGALMPLGTAGILETYRQALERCGSSLELVAPEPAEQQMVLLAIQASIAQEAAGRARARIELERLVARVQSAQGDELVVVEACTDLDYHVGLSSAAAYAAAVVDQVYGGD